MFVFRSQMTVWSAIFKLREPGKSAQELLSDNACVVATETKRVIYDSVDLGLPRLVGYVIQVALWIGKFKIDGRWNNVLLDGFRANDRFNGAGGAEHVTGSALGGTDSQFASVLTKYGFNGLGFGDVTLRRGGA